MRAAYEMRERVKEREESKLFLTYNPFYFKGKQNKQDSTYSNNIHILPK